jgi:hypothetical protein
MESCACFGCENNKGTGMGCARAAPPIAGGWRSLLVAHVDRTRANITRALEVKSYMETGGDIADRFTMQHWFMCVTRDEMAELEKRMVELS